MVEKYSGPGKYRRDLFGRFVSRMTGYAGRGKVQGETP
jgi:hypothetical protein